jgi:hypothetical protein
MLRIFLLCLFPLLITAPLAAQVVPDSTIRSMIQQFQASERGPYAGIFWFCPDGSLRPAQDPCPNDEGIQHARYRADVEALGRTNHVFLGQILASTDNEDFWDAGNDHSRAKQYQLGKYLHGIDDGWVLRKAQYYRGAYQIEDERDWGQDFFRWLLRNRAPLEEDYFFLRQLARDIPHGREDDRSQRIRAVSKSIGERYAAFQPLRVKIHGQPTPSDLQRVKEFVETHEEQLTTALRSDFTQLIADLEVVYRPRDLEDLRGYLRALPQELPVRAQLADFISAQQEASPMSRISAAADLMWQVRLAAPDLASRTGRLALLDLSNDLEELIFREVDGWPTPRLIDLIEKTCYLSEAAAGAGLLEIWEWQIVHSDLAIARPDSDALFRLQQTLDGASGVTEWGIGRIRSVYGEVIEQYQGFEPLATGYIDDIARGSVLLPLGHLVARLGDFVKDAAQLNNYVFDLANQSQVRGLNPGYARGELVVVKGATDPVVVDPNKIYAFERPPADLKPVAGIVTVTEGNAVSHVQLLARNLAIPNAVIPPQTLDDLQAYTGQEVFYAVSNQGTVILKPAEAMTEVEKALFAERGIDETRITVPVDQLRLDVRQIVDLREVRSTDSGRLCGPKAANLGQLKRLFPEQVVEGLVIPFGVFRHHLDQPMPGQEGSYWDFLRQLFAEAQQQPNPDGYILTGLTTFRAAMAQIELYPEFVEQLEIGFDSVLGSPLGATPVFLRSDTNMEDLKDFTGAGLNKTVFNVVDRQRILEGIRTVWASPYTERSYRWRQKYLDNPEHVFPSILIIPSVNCDYSGVMITKGLKTGYPDDVTVAFNRGVAGAVDGQAAETWQLNFFGGYRLLSPAREPTYLTIPPSGGSVVRRATFDTRILSMDDLRSLRILAAEVEEKLPQVPGVETAGPFDVELGFLDGKIWLFQVRPFVENSRAKTSEYLQSISPPIDIAQRIDLQARLE